MKDEIAGAVCVECEFPVFNYFMRRSEFRRELSNNENLKHLKKPENCEEFMEWATKRIEEKIKNPYGFKII